MAVWKMCDQCGSVVADMSIHEQWHDGHEQEVTDGTELEEASDPSGQ